MSLPLSRVEVVRREGVPRDLLLWALGASGGEVRLGRCAEGMGGIGGLEDEANLLLRFGVDLVLRAAGRGRPREERW